MKLSQRGDFRPTYNELAKLRAFFPLRIPVLATTATTNSQCLREICSCLGIDHTTSSYLNLGNDSPNISYHVHYISSTKDLDGIRPHLSHTIPSHSARSHLSKTIVFVNAVLLSQIAAREIQQWFPNHLRKCVDYLHAYRSPQAKQRVMDSFRRGEIKILIATEAAGMGADIPDIEQVIQFGVPSSLSVWMQRASRAGCSSSINARAILLAQYEWKKVDDVLRKWIEANECRRSIAGKNFNNPIEDHPAPTHICCDNCSSIALDASSVQERISTPEPIERSDDDETDVNSTPSTPTKSANGNRKRIMAQPQPSKPSRRHGPHLAQVRLSLQKWRVNTVRNSYTPGPFTNAAFMPDSVIKVLASNREIETAAQLQAAVHWAFAQRHAEDVLTVLRRVDAA
ncbi:P-loop containing nucleoside triphosphate hydrolase protein [Pholiota conissans]|uniref:DNA 3'-5' helicase n=1 Tax=Pholiota conissans TaxID=109636 RepID=A0A9P5YN62_9AGAR|nr:P-loop containing nucleoside triphosphate hydrolase protein [Pholiota conissans]